MGDQGSPDPVGRIRLTVFENGDISVTREMDGYKAQSHTYENRFGAIYDAMTDLIAFGNSYSGLFDHELRSGDTDADNLRPQEPPKPSEEQQDRG